MTFVDEGQAAASDQQRSGRLAVYFGFPPYMDASCVVAARRVAAAGVPVDLIQKSLKGVRPSDETLERIAGDLIRRRCMVSGPATWGGWVSALNFVDKGLEQIQEWTAEQGPYAEVVSRAHFMASNFLAAALKLQDPGVHWSAEFSDPLTVTFEGAPRASGPSPAGQRADEASQALRDMLTPGIQERGADVPRSDSIFEWAQHTTLVMADELVFISRQQQEAVLASVTSPALIESVKQRSTISAHPIPEERLYRVAKADRPGPAGVAQVGYFGSLSANRGMGAVLEGIAALPRDIRASFRLNVWSGQADEVRELARSLGVDDVVVARPSVPYLTMLSQLKQLDVLLLLDAEKPKDLPGPPCLPSKYADYLGSGTPIWAVLSEGSPLSELDFDWSSPLFSITGAMLVWREIADVPQQR